MQSRLGDLRDFSARYHLQKLSFCDFRFSKFAVNLAEREDVKWNSRMNRMACQPFAAILEHIMILQEMPRNSADTSYCLT